MSVPGSDYSHTCACAAAIIGYWAERGFAVKASVDVADVNAQGSVHGISSDMVDGLPTRRLETAAPVVSAGPNGPAGARS